jgi:hypothetical protein
VLGWWLDATVAWRGDLGAVVVCLYPFGVVHFCAMWGIRRQRERGGTARAPGSSWLVRGVVAATVLVARMCQSLLRGAGRRLPARTQGAEWACMRVVVVVAQCAVATVVLLAACVHRPSTTCFCVALPGRGEVGGSVGPRPSSS